jgi:hypothetical protein
MKIITLSMLFCCINIFGQTKYNINSNDLGLEYPVSVNDIYPLIKVYMENQVDSYCKIIESNKVEDNYYKYKAVSSEAFLKQSKVIFSTVVVGNKDAITSGSAFAYTQDKDKHKISANMTFASKKWNRTLFDVGTTISNKDDKYSYYSDGKWANDIAVRIGFNFRISAVQFVMDTTCLRHSQIRNTLMLEKMKEVKSVINLGLTSSELQSEIDTLIRSQRDSLALGKNTITKFKDTIDAKYKQLDLLKKLEDTTIPSSIKDDLANEWRSIMKKNNNFKGSNRDLTNAEKDFYIKKRYEKFVDDLLTEYDNKNNPFHGYSVWWINANIGVANSPFKIINDSLMVPTTQKKIESRMKSNFETSLNFNKVGLRTIQMLKVFTSFNQISFLDSPSLIGKKLSVQPGLEIPIRYYNVVDEENNIIQKYKNIRDLKYSMDLGVNYTNLFWFDRTLGFTGRAILNFSMFNNLEMLYERNYTLLAGPVFRATLDSKLAAATFSITGGVENHVVGEKEWDRFILKASVGIPFSIFENKK